MTLNLNFYFILFSHSYNCLLPQLVPELVIQATARVYTKKERKTKTITKGISKQEKKLQVTEDKVAV